MATTTYKVPTKREAELLEWNGIDPSAVMIRHKSGASIVLLNLKTNDDITIHAGFLSKRTFPDVWTEATQPNKKEEEE